MVDMRMELGNWKVDLSKYSGLQKAGVDKTGDGIFNPDDVKLMSVAEIDKASEAVKADAMLEPKVKDHIIFSLNLSKGLKELQNATVKKNIKPAPIFVDKLTKQGTVPVKGFKGIELENHPELKKADIDKTGDGILDNKDLEAMSLDDAVSALKAIEKDTVLTYEDRKNIRSALTIVGLSKINPKRIRDAVDKLMPLLTKDAAYPKPPIKQIEPPIDDVQGGMDPRTL